MASFSTWFSSWSPFRDDSVSNRVHGSAITEVEKPLHPNQRVEKIWTVNKRTTGQMSVGLDNLTIGTPGLTIVTVNPLLPEQHGLDVIARVRVTSDKREHLDHVSVNGSNKKEDCHVSFKDKNGGHGHMVTEITVATADQLQCIAATRGGDVVLDESIFISGFQDRSASITDVESSIASASTGPKRGLMLASLFGSRVFGIAQNTDMDFDNLVIGSVGSSTMYIAARSITTQKEMAAAMTGGGRVHIATQQFKANSANLYSVGEDGEMLLSATEQFNASTFDIYVRGKGFIDVAVSPNAVVACEKQSLGVKHGGRIDVADVQALATTVTFRGREGGNVKIHAPQTELTIKSQHQAGLVEYQGDLRPTVHTDNTSTLTPMAAGDARPRIQDKPVLPTIASAFESPVSFEKPSEGFWSAAVRPFMPF